MTTATTRAAVSAAVKSMLAAHGIPESGETPTGMAAEIAADLGVECDDTIVAWVDEAVADAAQR